ncbi:unnamed protein product [Taenia asiatica]|uniref:Protocadherin-16 n=1 Tax=Taenia asiatica TaxID=60517 RepID=A0A158R906_TAEAS|nr:unnamed protein product [Taenia asiatica]
MTTNMLPSCLLLLCFLHCQASISFPSPFASTFDVVEESPLGSTITGVADYLKRIVLLRVEMPNSTTFQLMGTDALTKNFVINEKSGELRTLGRIDREALCGSEVDPRNDLAIDSNCLKPLNILIKSLGISGASGSSMREKIMLRILDINDNAPRWPGKRLLAVKFVEAFQPLATYGKQEMIAQCQLLDRAIDPDSGPNGTVSYTLKGTGADMFRLEYADQDNGGFEHPDVSSPLRLKPVVPLDREVFEFYNLTLFAYDSGNPQRSSSIPLHVYITDVNDHFPVFHSYTPSHVSAYPRESKQGELVKYVPERGHLMETARIGSVVLQLNATDEDAGDNARITYSIFPSDVAFVQPYFALDPISGYLTVKQRLDYDSGPRRFTFKVLAVDGAPEPYRLTGTALVDIELTDYNDEPPNIEILIAQNGNLNSISSISMNGGITPMLPPGSKHQELVAYIDESPSPDIVIAYVQVSDKDENGEDQVECHLGPRDNFTLQADSTPSSGKMDHFGFETASLSERPNRRISEYRVLAKVPSGGDQSTREASSLQDRLDRETTPSQLLTIICEDRNGNHAEVRIRLHLLDINDNPPQFLNDSYFNFSLAENREPVGNQQVWLGRVQAVDPDLGENARILYHLAPDQNTHLDGQFGSSPQQLFRVQPDTGDIYAQVSLDRENAPENGVYSFNVLAIDNGKPRQLTGTARVDVIVLDVNDWPPEFTRDIYTFEVPEDLELREVVGVVEAVDRDATAGANSITYHLNPPRAGLVQRSLKNDTMERRKRDYMLQQQQPLFMPHLEPSKVRDERPLSYFSIDSRSGEIRVIRKLDRESNGYFTFEVLAIDSPLAGSSAQSMSPSQPSQSTRRGFKGGEVFTATATVVVTLTDVNDNAPEFRYPNTSILLHMAPGETLGHKILTVQAVDADYGENARISYSIRSEIPIPQDGPGTGNFAIDETSGLIFLTRPTQGPVNHRLVIEACDHGVQPKCTSSPAIQIAVSEDAKLVSGGVGGGVGSDGNLVGGGGGSINGGGGTGGRALDRSDIAGSDHRFNNLDGFYDGFYDQNPPHRVEVIAACLVVVFGVLLLAAVVLVCLLKRRPLVNGQQRPNHQNQQHQERLDYTCTPLWNCQWSFFRHQKSASAKRNAQHYVPAQTQEVLNDPRFSDGQSIESSVAKGMISTDSITNTLEEEKKPLYYDGLGVLALDAMAPRGIRHPAEYSTAEGGGGGGMPVPVVFTGPPPRVYGTLPVVSTIISDGQTATTTLVARPGFQPRAGRGHSTSITPPSPDYQSLDQLAGRPVWQAGPHHSVDMFVGSPRTSRPVNNKSTSSSSASYGCLIDPPCINTSRRNNHYEVSSGGSGRPRQRSATLGRLGAMTEEESEAGENNETTGPMGGKRGGVLAGGSNTTTRSYSQLQATTGVEADAVERDRPTRYTYQAIREASFV